VSATNTQGLRPTYNCVLNKVEQMLLEKLRLLHSHLAGPNSFHLGTNCEMGIDVCWVG
jgi:hypothetical protein